jgi:hypothetical protein
MTTQTEHFTNIWSKRIETATNLAILCAFVLVAVLAAKSLYEPSRGYSSGPQVGSSVSLPGVDWSKSDRNLVLALSEQCHFCTDSAGFYRRLVPAAATARVPVVAVLPQPASEGRSYLEKLNVHGTKVVASPLSAVDASGTPTILLVDRKGKIRRAWVGKLNVEEQGQVTSALYR